MVTVGREERCVQQEAIHEGNYVMTISKVLGGHRYTQIWPEIRAYI